MTNAELIKALRHCGKGGDIAERCLPCDYYDREPWCEAALVNDAADALEAAEQQIADLEKSYSWKAYAALEESIEGYKERIADFEAQRIADLEAQMPKEGEWIIKPHGTYGQLRAFCSACGKHSGIGGIVSNQKKPYCPNCGARMRGEHDD